MMKNKILTLRKQGYSYNEIVSKLSCSKSTVSYHCSKLESNKELEKINNFKRNNFLKLIPSEICEIIELRKQKKSYDFIKNKTDISIHKIRLTCKEFDLVNSRNCGPIDDDTIDKIRTLYTKLKSIRKVQKKNEFDIRYN